MWILFVLRPRTLRDFMRLARLYGMSMASIRFDEAWAMAIWMEREGSYHIDRSEDRYTILRWPSGRVTRTRDDETDPHEEAGAEVLAIGVTKGQVACFLSRVRQDTFRFTEFPLDEIPFTYDLGGISPDAISFWPGSSQERMSDYAPIPPAGELTGFLVRSEGEVATLVRSGKNLHTFERKPSGTSFYKGKAHRLSSVDDATLEPTPADEA